MTDVNNSCASHGKKKKILPANYSAMEPNKNENSRFRSHYSLWKWNGYLYVCRCPSSNQNIT